MMPDDDFVLAYMKTKNIKLTLRNYLQLAYFGNPPELTAELIAELPRIFQKSAQRRAR